MRLAEPYWLILLIFVPLPWLVERARPRVRWPSLGLFPPRGWRVGGSGWRRQVPLVLRAAAIGCVVSSLARPQTVAGRIRVAARGVAIVVALDISGSMTTVDFPVPEDHDDDESGRDDDRPKPVARLEAAKGTIDRFIRGRPDDLIGLVTFATYPDLTCPPTLDHDVLLGLVASVEPAPPDEDATNIGDAIAWSLRAVLEATPEEKVIILLTDGENRVDPSKTPEAIAPEEAAGLVRRLGARLHTIGVGLPGGVIRLGVPGTGLSYPASNRSGYDPEALARLAEAGGGTFFAAADAEGLADVFDQIDQLETSPVTGEILTRYQEEFAPWAATALVLLAIDRLLAIGRARRLP